MKKIIIIALIVLSANMTNSYSQEQDTCIKKDLFIECEVKRMELEAKNLTLAQYYDIEKHNKKQTEKFAIISWIITGVVIVSTLIYTNKN